MFSFSPNCYYDCLSITPQYENNTLTSHTNKKVEWMSETQVKENQNETRAIPQEAFDWYDEYAHGLIDRREFLSRLSGLAVLGFTMTTLTTALLPNYALAEQVSFNDPAIKASYAKFPSPKGSGEGKGYLVVPAKLEGTAPVG
jgi:carboxymethylenebutenolidase